MARNLFLLNVLHAICLATIFLTITAISERPKRRYKLGIAPDDSRIINRNDMCPPTCPSDCLDLYNAGYVASGVFTVYLSTDSMRPLQVFCDSYTAPGGWLVFQRRAFGSLDFNRTWEEYEEGFGQLLSEFWFGNNDLSMLLAEKVRYQLRITLRYEDEYETYATYMFFGVGHKLHKYGLCLSCGGYKGTTGDKMMPHSSMKFSTYDSDNDPSDDNCASMQGGGWWYNATCSDFNLNGDLGSISSCYNNSRVTYTGISFRPL